MRRAFRSQEVRYENNTIIWKVVEPEPEGEYHFDTDEYLATIHEAFTWADGFKEGEWEDFNIGPHGFSRTTSMRCLERLTAWRDLRRRGIS